MSDDEGERSDPRDLFEHTDPLDEDGRAVEEPGDRGDPGSDADASPADGDGDAPPEIETDDGDRPELIEGEGERSGPLGDVADRVEERRREREDAPFDDLFEDVEVGSVDSDALWDQIDAEGPVSEAVGEDPDVGERVVKKSIYCQRCEYFEAPPDVGCTNEGTRIEEVVDMDHFRVRNCPVVEENERLEKMGVGEERE